MSYVFLKMKNSGFRIVHEVSYCDYIVIDLTSSSFLSSWFITVNCMQIHISLCSGYGQLWFITTNYNLFVTQDLSWSLNRFMVVARTRRNHIDIDIMKRFQSAWTLFIFKFLSLWFLYFNINFPICIHSTQNVKCKMSEKCYFSYKQELCTVVNIVVPGYFVKLEFKMCIFMH